MGEQPASIGPRSIDRGNWAGGLCWWRFVSGLQLGRGRSTAETRTSTSRPARMAGLQLGRGRSTAETRSQRFEHEIQEGASIGPRSIDRGNGPHCVPVRNLRHASIGPRSIDRGNNPLARVEIGDRRGFNWAAVDRPRKLAQGISLGNSPKGFNWAAVDRPRKPRGCGDAARRHESFNWAAVDRPRKPCPRRPIDDRH